jgi:hypothetical protein
MDLSNFYANAGAYQAAGQNFQTQLDQWVAQAKQQAQQQGFYGIGTQTANQAFNLNIPQAPSREIFVALANLEDDFQQSILKGLQDFNNQCIARKEKVFATNHYEFDANGSPVLGENGLPQLVEGAETADQYKLRTDWETKKKDDLGKQHDAELDAYIKNTVAESTQLMTEARKTTDPARIKQIYERLDQLSSGEIALRAQIYLEDLKVGMEGLPDVIGGGTLTDFVDNSAAALKNKIEADGQAVANSPEAQMIKAYYEKMLAYNTGLWSQFLGK